MNRIMMYVLWMVWMVTVVAVLSLRAGASKWWALSVRINKFKSIFNCWCLSLHSEFATNQCLMNVRTSIGLVFGAIPLKRWRKKNEFDPDYKCSVPNFKLLNLPSCFENRPIPSFGFSFGFVLLRDGNFSGFCWNAQKSGPIFNTLDQTKCRRNQCLCQL